MRLFDKTLRGLDSYVNDHRNNDIYLRKGYTNESVYNSSSKSKNFSNHVSNQRKSELIIDFNEDDLKRFISPSPLRFSEITIGDHPDFKHMDHDDVENHYAVSLFMDIKGSTRLIEVADDLEELRRLKDTILTLAIRVCNYFGGHVQRLQGDGIFVLFARKNHHPNDAIIGALNASSILTYFVKNELAPKINELGIDKPIQIRTGLDYGRTGEVMWSRYGIPGCNELTTTSLHTDLAAKLQQKAASNGIMIGNNIKEALDLEDFISTRTYQSEGEKKEDKYYRISETRRYVMWKFDWQKYLLSFTCCSLNDKGDLKFDLPEKRLRCIRKDTGFEYTENSYALPKGIKVRFELINRHGGVLNNYPIKKIRWEILNTGSEARGREQLSPSLVEKNDETSIEVDTAYLGQHKMRCSIGSGINWDKLDFSVFVQSSNNQLNA